MTKAVLYQELADWVKHKKQHNLSFSEEYSNGYADALTNLLQDISEGLVSTYNIDEPKDKIL
jgi:hypothetical protein